MSYEKHVYPSTVPAGVERLWLKELQRHGLEVQFDPTFELRSWGGGYLPCSLVIRPGSFQTSSSYAPGPLCAGFELDVTLDSVEKAFVLSEYVREMAAGGTPLPRSLVKRLRAAPAILGFTHGGFSWSAAEFRLCWYAAAALAHITDGLLFDEWSSDNFGYLDPGQAFQAAAVRSLEYELASERPAHRWAIPAFQGWQS